jgi:hypothetical protein
VEYVRPRCKVASQTEIEIGLARHKRGDLETLHFDFTLLLFTMMSRTIFIPGLSEKSNKYRFLLPYVKVANINWNKPIINGKCKNIASFSFGGILACNYALKNNIENLILCSLTPGIETLKKVKVKNVTFLVGEEEKWETKEIKRVSKTLKCNYKIIIIPKSGHAIKGKYKTTLISILRDLASSN